MRRAGVGESISCVDISRYVVVLEGASIANDSVRLALARRGVDVLPSSIDADCEDVVTGDGSTFDRLRRRVGATEVDDWMARAESGNGEEDSVESAVGISTASERGDKSADSSRW